MDFNVGIIGGGWVAEQHVKALQKVPGVKIAAVADVNLQRAQNLASGVGAVAFDTYRKLLSSQKLDAVYVLVPPFLHGEIEFECSKRVGAIFVEKPVSNDLDTAEKIAQTFSRAGTITAAGFMNRYRSSSKRAHELFSQSGNGPVIIDAWWVNEMPPPLWWRTLSQSGGQFVEQCTHLVDLSRFLAGEIIEVHAYAAQGFVTDVADYSVYDATTVNVKFASGAIGNFMTACHPKNGTDSDNAIGLTIASRTVKCSFTGWEMGLAINHGKERGVEHVSTALEDIFLIEDSAFIQAARTKDQSLIKSSYSDAVKTLKVGLAANESVRIGKPIKI